MRERVVAHGPAAQGALWARSSGEKCRQGWGEL